MARVIPVFFDFACPWSYSARLREKKMADELDVRFEYMPWELAPDVPHEGVDNPHAAIGGELQQFAESVGRTLPTRERAYNTHKLLAGLYAARAAGRYDAYVDRAFQAVWEDRENVHEDAVVRRVAEDAGLDPDRLLEDVNAGSWDPHLLAVDAYGEELGVQSTVTYVLPDGDGQRAYRALEDTDAVTKEIRHAFGLPVRV